MAKITFIHVTWALAANSGKENPEAQNHYVAECRIRDGFADDPDVKLLRHVGSGPAARMLAVQLADRATNEKWSESALCRAVDAENPKRSVTPTPKPKRNTAVVREEVDTETGEVTTRTRDDKPKSDGISGQLVDALAARRTELQDEKS